MAFKFLNPVNWTGSPPLFLKALSWGEVSTTKSASDTILVVVSETSALTDIKAATDVITAVVVDTSQPIVQAGTIPKSGSDTITPVIVDTAQVLNLTIKTASDVITPVLGEFRQLFGGGQFIFSFDIIQPQIVEFPTGAWIGSTDDIVAPVIGEVGTSPAAIPKTASDIINPILFEQWQIADIGEVVKTASDTITPIVIDTVQAVIKSVTITASDVITPNVVDTVNRLEKPFAVAASDTIIVGVVEQIPTITKYDVDIGALPPGWVDFEQTELTGIERPKRYEPFNTNNPVGWFRRTYWVAIDESGRIRATDRWRSTVRARAWTEYQSGKHALM